MNTPTRLGVFGVGLAVAFAAAVGVGRATGPVGPVGPDDDRTVSSPPSGPADPAEAPGGLATSQDGHTLTLSESSLEPGRRELAFTITDDSGTPVTDFDVEHEKLLHLIVVRRDFTGFQHLHPELDRAGTWRTDVDLAPGAWRVFADFTPSGGDGMTLGTDLVVPGRVGSPPTAPPGLTTTVDGYTVALDGDLVAGEHAMLELTVSKDGEPVTDLDPYLGSYGHLVALREGDLAYLHVHPEDGPAGPAVEFGAEVPSAGRYHLYLDFQHEGVVRTATFVVDAATNPLTGGATDDDHDSGSGSHGEH